MSEQDLDTMTEDELRREERAILKEVDRPGSPTSWDDPRVRDRRQRLDELRRALGVLHLERLREQGKSVEDEFFYRTYGSYDPTFPTRIDGSPL